MLVVAKVSSSHEHPAEMRSGLQSSHDLTVVFFPFSILQSLGPTDKIASSDSTILDIAKLPLEPQKTLCNFISHMLCTYAHIVLPKTYKRTLMSKIGAFPLWQLHIHMQNNDLGNSPRFNSWASPIQDLHAPFRPIHSKTPNLKQ